MKEHLAIFDFDGTLFDTVPANYAAYAHALSRQGVTLSQDEFSAHCNGRYYKDFLPALLSDDLALAETVHREKVADYPRYYDRIRENRPLFDLLAALRPTYYTALVSTATKTSVWDILHQFHRVDNFDLVLTQAEVPKKKPAPDGFLQAMAYFRVSPARTIVFEDAPEGIEAARRAGAQCFVVRDILHF